MRNTLKLSLLGTLLCTMSIIFSNGYSMEEGDSFFTDKDGYVTFMKPSEKESDEDFVKRVGFQILKAHAYGSIIYNKKDGTFGGITKSDYYRYKELIKKLGKNGIYEILAKSGDKDILEKLGKYDATNLGLLFINYEKEESDEEFIKKFKWKLNGVQTFDPKTGVLHCPRGEITQEEIDRYNKLMDEKK